MELEKHYDKLWSNSLQNFENGTFQFDNLIDSDIDNRYGVSLLARPCREVRNSVSNMLEELKAIAPHQYYYPESDLHLTVLSIISCYPGFTVDEINPSEYRNLIQSAAKMVEPFHVEFRGLTASPSCILVQGFPQNDALAKLRNTLRDKFRHSHLQHSIDKRYKLQTAHLTVIRFKESLVNREEFIRAIEILNNQTFGRCFINQLEVVANDWYQRKENVELLDTISLTKG